ncbi:hypothetical protein, partial [Paenibacillus sp. A51L]
MNPMGIAAGAGKPASPPAGAALERPGAGASPQTPQSRSDASDCWNEAGSGGGGPPPPLGA